MQSENNRNMIIAIVLSVVVLFGWQFFIAGPQLEQAQKRAARAGQQAPSSTPTTASQLRLLTARGPSWPGRCQRRRQLCQPRCRDCSFRPRHHRYAGAGGLDQPHRGAGSTT